MTFTRTFKKINAIWQVLLDSLDRIIVSVKNFDQERFPSG